MTDEPFDDKKARFVEIIANNGTLDDVAAALNVHRTTPLRWLREDATGELRNHYARAREDQGDLSADEIKDAARRVARGEIDPQAGRVLIDALKWDAGKRKPKVYGDKLAIGGADDLVAIQVQQVHRVIVDPKHSNG
jgi:hypothetical protein